MRWLALLVLVAGCERLFGVDSPAASDGGTDGDGSSRFDAPACIGASFITYCPKTAPLTLILSGPFDTDDNPMCAGDVAATCVVTGSSIFVSGPNLVVSGARPLALLAEDHIDIVGTIDVSSSLAFGRRGAGANDAACSPISVTNAMAPPNDWASGGPGGSFGALGGNGGAGWDTRPVAPGTMVTSFVRLRGGCGGIAGGTAGGAAAVGGSSGGGVALVANNAVSITGAVIASGSAGAGGLTGGCSGGGGGGSGGAVVVQAPSIAVSGTIYAAGGGGGSGGKSNGPGSPGTDPDPNNPLGNTATGGPGTAGGGGGGNGGWHGGASGGNGAAGDSCALVSGGGGGGGSLGIVELDGVNKTTTGATIVAVQIQ